MKANYISYDFEKSRARIDEILDAKDTSYEFKYLVDGNFMNEPGADSYRWNDFAGSENSVLNL